jgi:outer membrane murein-binding lipoprotein Lpp
LLSYFSDIPEGDKQVVDRTSTFVADKKGKLKERVMPMFAIKAESFDHYDDLALSQSLKMTGGNNLSVASGNNLNVANKPQKETKHLSEEEIKPKPELENEAADESETEVILSAEELMKLSPEEMMKYAEKQAMRKIKLDMAAKITAQEKAIQEAKAADKFKDIQTKFAQLIAKFDELATEVKTIAAKQAIHEQKMIKMESTPVETPASSTAPAPQVNLLEQAQGCKSFSDFQLKISRNGVQ